MDIPHRRILLHAAFWESKHNPNTPIALWIGHIRVAADELLTINELPTDRQIANRLVAGLGSSWSAVKDSIIYTAQEMLLDDNIGALEAQEVSLNGTPSTDFASDSFASSKRFGCSNCGKRGHKSSECRKPKTKAGAVSAVKLGGYDSGSFEDREEVDVVYE
ncbi:hypothetical protein PGT21_035984 [Puccinia graminis f. sp. tritici]|uniref:CCHC-type domain-containing protein n=1 Tax=Puccinia graminis f. sp. tritici TaxID=56615 RepID=A0A5B0RBI2_PUCGR|nr:hypothetical protein PGT21_035984 [Puccinia graminis f. sp. tritici]KAA1123030.1 hypothetical protein PGTUg99_009777 [Puccinia graminis f. sp. tritici]